MPDLWPAAPPPVAPAEALPARPPREPVKVLHVITRLAGGSGGNTLASAVGMDRDRYACWIAGAAGGRLWAEAEAAGLGVARLGRMREQIAPADDAATLLELVRLLRRERFTVVHTHCAKAGLLGRVAARLAGVPVVVHTFHALTAHEHLGRGRRLGYLALDRAVRGLADAYVTVAPTLGLQLVRSGVAPAGSVTVVPSGIDLAAVPTAARPDLRRELGIPPTAPVVGTVGRLVAQKAPLDFVRMAAEVRRVRPDAVFVMVGDASTEERPLEAETRAEAARLGVDVRFTGHRDDAVALAATFDVYVVPSLYEGLGRALTEALASARPVVATAVNGVPDLVEHGATGLLVRPGDPAGLAAAVCWVLDHPAQARAMGAQGRARVLEAFDASAMCAALDGLYSRLLGVGVPPEVLAPEGAADRRGPAERAAVAVPAQAPSVIDLNGSDVAAAPSNGHRGNGHRPDGRGRPEDAHRPVG